MKQIEERLQRIEQLVLIGTKTVLNVAELALMTGLSSGRIYHLVSSRDIPHYKKGKSVFFKKSEIEEWQLQDRVPTNSEIDSKAATYISTHR